MSTVADVNAWVALITALEPLAAPVIIAIIGLIKSHPEVTPEQWTLLVQQMAANIDAKRADTLATIAADQQKQSSK